VSAATAPRTAPTGGAAVTVLPCVRLVLADALNWMTERDERSVHAIVTDPPYGLREYDEDDHDKLREGRGGIWRIPPVFDCMQRSALPRFTVLIAK